MIRLPQQLWKLGLCGSSSTPIWWLEVADGLVVEYNRSSKMVSFPSPNLTLFQPLLSETRSKRNIFSIDPQ